MMLLLHSHCPPIGLHTPLRDPCRSQSHSESRQLTQKHDTKARPHNTLGQDLILRLTKGLFVHESTDGEDVFVADFGRGGSIDRVLRLTTPEALELAEQVVTGATVDGQARHVRHENDLQQNLMVCTHEQREVGKKGIVNGGRNLVAEIQANRKRENPIL